MRRIVIIMMAALSVFATQEMYAAPDQPRTLYRIRGEEGVRIPDNVVLTPDERKALSRLEAVLQRWPTSLWIVSDNGVLRLVKMDADGKPIK